MSSFKNRELDFVLEKLGRKNRTIKLKDFEKIVKTISSLNNTKYEISIREKSIILKIEGFGIQVIHHPHSNSPSLLNSITLIEFRRVFRQALQNIGVFDKL